MDSIARTAYGVEIDSQKELDHPFRKHAGPFFGVPKTVTTGSKLKQHITIILKRMYMHLMQFKIPVQ